MRFLQLDAYTIIARIAIILLILPLHEFAHGWAAKKCGDDTAALSGRLTLNPFAHVDPVGAILLLLTGFGWAKPVPINPIRMRNMRRGVILTALAGPLSNLLVAFLGMIIMRFCFIFSGVSFVMEHTALYYVGDLSQTMYIISMVFISFVSVNLGLAIFNLIPIPPLDGSKVLMGFLSYKPLRWIEQHQQVISIIFMVLVLTGSLSTPIGWIRDRIFALMWYATNWIALLVG